MSLFEAAKGHPEIAARLLSRFLRPSLREDDEARAGLIWIAWIAEHIPALAKALTNTKG